MPAGVAPTNGYSASHAPHPLQIPPKPPKPNPPKPNPPKPKPNPNPKPNPPPPPPVITIQAPRTHVEPMGQSLLSIQSPVSGFSRKNCGAPAGRVTLLSPLLESAVNETGFHAVALRSVMDSTLYMMDPVLIGQ